MKSNLLGKGLKSTLDNMRKECATATCCSHAPALNLVKVFNAFQCRNLSCLFEQLSCSVAQVNIPPDLKKLAPYLSGICADVKLRKVDSPCKVSGTRRTYSEWLHLASNMDLGCLFYTRVLLEELDGKKSKMGDIRWMAKSQSLSDSKSWKNQVLTMILSLKSSTTVRTP